jgi:uncharacterized lipoprotein YddW (UPF0748 family)
VPLLSRRLVGALTTLALLCCGPLARGEFSDFRAIFVNRFEYASNASSINAIMQNAADLGITDVMFQVRGRADAFYNSAFEPKASNVPAGFDPLQVAINAAHSRGLRIHAWMNTMPMWNSTTLPTSPNHIFYNDDPSFRIQYLDGTLEPPNGNGGGYSIANPILPEVHTHINNVVNDIASNYNVDGIHLDYIRYVSGSSFNALPHDPQSHAMFLAETGLDGSNPANSAAYKNFIERRITDLVATLGQTVNAVETVSGRTIDYSASVWRDPGVGEADYMQDYRTWLENDLLDIVMPMIYLSSSNDHLFNPNLLNSLNVPSNSRVVPTIGTYLHTASAGGTDLTVSQLQRAYQFGADGAAFYGYGSLFTDALAADRRAAITAFYDSLAPVPGQPGNVLDDFEVDQGRFRWAYNLSPQTTGLAAATTIERTTDEAHRGIASQRLNLVASGSSDWQLRHNSGLTTPAAPAGNVPLEATGYVGFWLKTTDANVDVRIAIDDPFGANPSALEVGFWQSVVADGQWHLYQWNLEDANHWSAFAGGADGAISASIVSIDSIFFRGNGSVELFLDTVSHNPAGPLAAAPLPGDFNGDGSVDGADLAIWKDHFGTASGATSAQGDANGDGAVDGADFLAWQRHQGASSVAAGTAAAASIPEPTAAALALLAGVAALSYRRGY